MIFVEEVATLRVQYLCLYQPYGWSDEEHLCHTLIATTVIQYCRIREFWRIWDIKIKAIVKGNKSSVKMDYFTGIFFKRFAVPES